MKPGMFFDRTASNFRFIPSMGSWFSYRIKIGQPYYEDTFSPEG
jgi:hypothetical protein